MNLFVAGSDTSVGKTVTSAVLCLKLGWQYWKPIQSGTETGTDSEFIRKFIEPAKVKNETYRLKKPLSPHTAAQIDGIKIETSSILKEYKLLDRTIIEGAGGLLVPINADHLLVDLIKLMSVAIVLVVRSGLGTINHTLLSIEALRRRNLVLKGVILVGDQNTENRKAIEHYGKVDVLGEIPMLQNLDIQTLCAAGKAIGMDDGLEGGS